MEMLFMFLDLISGADFHHRYTFDPMPPHGGTAEPMPWHRADPMIGSYR